MVLKDILVISGQGGLFKYISQGRNSVIVEGLTDQKRTTIPATTKISMLEDIAVFTEKDDIPLREVFRKIQEKEGGGAAIPHKSPDAELKKYFAQALPDYDKDRVYVSDIRKMVLWYNMLRDMGITDFEPPEDETKENEGGETSDEAQAGENETSEAAEATETPENQ